MTELSPAAQAVLDALDDQFYELNSQHLAAAVVALRTAADHLEYIDSLYEIATELENHV